MATILVNKYGMTFWTREATTNAGGEQGETEGIIRELIRVGHRVIYYGPTKGSMPCPTIKPDTRGLDTDAAIGEQEERWETFDLPKLKEYEPYDMMIQVNGMPPTRCMIDNPAYTRCQQFAIARCAPSLMAVNYFKIPRICVNNDPRAYARDHEWTDMMPDVMPAALLDQTSGTHYQKLNKKKYSRRSVYAAAESWGYMEKHEGLPWHERDDFVVLSHAHVNDGIGKSDWSRWTFLQDTDLPVYGKGWDQCPFRVNWKGVATASEVPRILGQYKFTPVVSHTKGFLTGKPYVALNSRCLPVIVGDRGSDCPWDLNEEYLTLDDPHRLRHDETLHQWKSRVNIDDWHERAYAMFQPNFNVLHACVDWFAENKEYFRENPFGGYFDC